MASISWNTASSGNWTTAADWSTGTVPTSADSVTISHFGSYAVSITTAVSAQYLTINPSADKIDVLRETAGSIQAQELNIDSGGTVLDSTNYIHFIELYGGTLTAGSLSALGLYDNLAGGTLLLNASGSTSDVVTLFNSSTLAVAHGMSASLELDTDSRTTSSTVLTVGTQGYDGTLVITSTGFHDGPASVSLQYGTIVDHAGFFSKASLNMTAGATVDLQGQNLALSQLSGYGSIVNSLSPAILTVGGASYAGAIVGAIQLSVTLNYVFDGLVAVTGGTVIAPASAMYNYGRYDLVNNLGIAGGSGFSNAGTLAKTGGTGVSAITAQVANYGAVVANHGSIAIADFTSVGGSGFVHGRQNSYGPNGLLVSAATTRDLSDDGNADILFRNAAGVVYLYTMNAATVTNGATISTQVGTNWKIKGIGDFDGNGSADLLWMYNNASNASDPLNGVSYITLQSGGLATSSQVFQQLPAAWQVAGVGDFDGDGLSDVLYRNTSTGQTYIDFMNGTTIEAASGFTSAQIADQDWRIAGVGDFDEDGKADILWRYDNTSNASDPLNGVIYEWTMNGTNVVSQGLLTSQPGSDKWQVAGTGDFDGDGHTDILFRYENAANVSDPLNGFTYIDFMNGSQVTSGAPTQWQIDNSWAIASIGDFSGDGKSDILFQRASDGATYLWSMNGAATTSGAFTSMQSGPGWTVQNGVLNG